MESDNQVVEYFLLPGGRLPEKGEGEARAYDVFCPYLITGPEMDPTQPYRRKVLWDFSDPDKMPLPLPEKIRKNIEFRKVDNRYQWVYVLPPKRGDEIAEVHIGLGKRITQIKFEGPGGNFYPVFEKMAKLTGLRVTERGVKSHNSTGVGELKKTTQKIPTHT